MPIGNREMDVAGQRETITYTRLLAALGSYMVWVAPFPFEIVKVAASARVLSGAPALRADINKFNGTNSISAMVALTYPAYGTSGAFSSASIGTAGSSLVQGNAGDSIWLVASGANTASDDLCVEIVVKKLQDIVTHFAG